MIAPTLEEIKLRAAKVNGGSGVLLPALNIDYSYIFTARHNVLRDSERLDSLLEPAEVVVTLHDDSVCSPIRIFVSEVEDAAVLLVPFQEVDPVDMSASVRMEETMWLVGYPQLRRQGAADPIRSYRGAIESFDRNFKVEISTQSFAAVDEVRGSSGGGVYILVDDRWVLVAIECSMEGLPIEGHNWLTCWGIPVFERLIRKNSLAPVLPPFLLSFAGLREGIFPLPGFECPETKARLRAILDNVAERRLDENCPTPRDIMEAFGVRLLVKPDGDGVLTDRKLWVSSPVSERFRSLPKIASSSALTTASLLSGLKLCPDNTIFRRAKRSFSMRYFKCLSSAAGVIKARYMFHEANSSVNKA